MSEDHGGVPLPLPEFLRQVKLSEERVPATESIRNASVGWQLIEDYRPLAESLEWQLASLHWMHEGVLPFVQSGVPYLVNNDGLLSANSAALLFANCLEAAPDEGRIVVLELGAGTGLFARYFLDEFRLLCERGSRDFYQRLSYYVTDRSPRTVSQWQERGIFAEHAGHAIARVCDASQVRETVKEPVQAVFCNYLLDSLPAAKVRRTVQGWEQLAVRTWIVDDAALLRNYTELTFDQIRERAAAADPEARSQLLPLLPLLELEADFKPVGRSGLPDLNQLKCERGGAGCVFNYGAIECLEALLGSIAPSGFVLVNDYSPANDEGNIQALTSQRFGPTTAVGLNFPLIEEHFRRCSATVLIPEGDADVRIHARLLLRGDAPGTRRTFEERFAARTRENAQAPCEQARQEAAAGLWRDALASYRTAIDQNPRDWQLIGEAAEFVATQLKDYATGLELAREAVALNPWYSPRLWNVLGECLASLQRPAEAHECYLQAHRIHPNDPQTNLKLAQSWLSLGDAQRSLEAVARGLANDSSALFRHTLLDQQQQAIGALTKRWHAERETAARRQA
ncbi:MAG TPA: SAM-dependent methyltransferase [Bryobacteraceae bacterium]|nr:SAM-dependent methyltransferase [Bryobacteraceae bacterium]